MNDEIARREADPTTYRSDGQAFWYDRQGNPISGGRAEMLLRSVDYRRIGGDTVVVDGKTLAVSTVWLGVNHNFTGDGPPLIFETMVFGDHVLAEDACWRYATEDGARAGHAAVVHALRTVRLTSPDHHTEEGGEE